MAYLLQKLRLNEKGCAMAYDVQEIARACDLALRRLDMVTANLANAQTPGFKQEYLLVTGGEGGTEGVKEERVTDFRPGALQTTGNRFDLAIEGEGFFVIQQANGLAYTRRGDFTLDRDGYLVTQAGERVRGTGGPIQITGGVVGFDRDGTVLVDGAAVGKLSVVRFKDQRLLTRNASGYFETNQQGEEVREPVIKSGFLEASNVNVLKEMVNMIDVHRTVEAYQKLIQTIDNEDKQSTGRVGRLA